MSVNNECEVMGAVKRETRLEKLNEKSATNHANTFGDNCNTHYKARQTTLAIAHCREVTRYVARTTGEKLNVTKGARNKNTKWE
jgi:hypothetical protein